MNKKSLLISIACTVVATLGLAIYTLVTLLGVKAPVKPTNTTVALAFRTNDEIVELSSYTEEQMSFEYSDETNPSIIFDEATGKYFAAKGGNAEVVVELDSLETKRHLISLFMIKLLIQMVIQQAQLCLQVKHTYLSMHN